MKTLIATFALLALSALGVGAHAEYAPPPKGTWGVGVMGPGTFYDDGQPSVKYFATDKLAIELVPVFRYDRIRPPVGGAASDKNFIFNFDTLYRLGSYDGVNLSLFAGIGLKNFYNRQDFGNKNTARELFVNTGFEVEYFLRPDLSVGARSFLSSIYGRNMDYSSAGSNGNSSFKILFWGAHGVNVHYYFTPPSTDDHGDSAPATTKWALGWQGFGDAYGRSQPSIKYLFSDKNAIELIPEWTWTHSDSQATYQHSQNFTLPIDWVHTLIVHGPVTFSSVVEPEVGLGYTDNKFSATNFNQSYTRIFGLGAGVETEYYVLPTLSFGARLLVNYQQFRTSNYNQFGYQGMTVSTVIRPTGQVLSVRWYF